MKLKRLGDIRDRKKDPKLFHNLLLAQEDRENLISLVDDLQEQLAEANEKLKVTLEEQRRLRRSLE